MRTGDTVTYAGVDFDVVCSGNKNADGYIHLKLNYKLGRTIIAQRNAQAKTDTELDAQVMNKTAPELLAAIIPHLREEFTSDGPYNDITIFWNIWKRLVAQRNRWNENTTAEKEKLLNRVFPFLIHKPMKSLDTIDYIEAAQKAENAMLSDRRYSKIGFIKLLSKLSAVATLVGICEDDPLESFVENIRNGRDPIGEIKDHLRTNSLSVREERKIYEIIKNNMEESYSYFGVALVMLGGLTYGEACALTVADIRESKCFPGLHSILVSKECRTDKKSPNGSNSSKRSPSIENISLLETRTSYRAVPMSSVLDSLYMIRLNQISASVKESTANKYLVCKGKVSNAQMSPNELSDLCNSIIKEAGVAESASVRNADNSGKEIKITLPKDLLRQNFAYRLRWTCKLKEAEIKYLTGKSCMDTDIRHYRDMLSDFELLSLKNRIDNWAFPTVQMSAEALTQEYKVIEPSERHIQTLYSPDSEKATLAFVNLSTEARQTVEILISSRGSFLGSSNISVAINCNRVEED